MQSINTTNFKVKKQNLFGEDLFLTNPNLGVKWNQTNLHCRSIIKNKDGKIVSCGFKKFFNFHECPDIEPWNNSWTFNALDKRDGSLLIVSYYNGNVIARTRGTFDASTLDNGEEINFLKQKYPKLFECPKSREGFSYLLEWETPTNRIVLEPPKEPTLTFLGCINHIDLKYATQRDCDFLADLLDIQRPKYYSFQNIEEALKDVKFWKEKEGIVIYSPDGQTIKKIKTEQYLKAHYLMTQLNTKGIVKMMEIYGFPSREVFYQKIESEFDYEVVSYVKDKIDKIYLHKYEFDLAWIGAIDLAKKLNTIPRKKAAEHIKNKTQGWRRTLAFLALDNQQPKLEFITKIILHECK